MGRAIAEAADASDAGVEVESTVAAGEAESCDRPWLEQPMMPRPVVRLVARKLRRVRFEDADIVL